MLLNQIHDDRSIVDAFIAAPKNQTRVKHLKKIIRMCGLVLFLVLAVAGIGILGMAPTLTKDNKLFADQEYVVKKKEEKVNEIVMEEEIKG
jgi:hypothetical protein